LKTLAEQRLALVNRCENYDSGAEWEACHIAGIIFTMLHDGGSIISILTQLGIRGRLRFISSGDVFRPEQVSTYVPLVMFRAQQTSQGVVGKTIPLLDDAVQIGFRHNQFPTWWAKEPIYHDGQVELTRRRLIFALRHQDGGGHVGRLTDDAYIRMKSSAIGFVQSSNQVDQPLYVMAASMRQIAWELTKTLDEFGVIQ
jgi:hypothetical protein